MNKIIKLQIIKPLNIDWKSFDIILYQLQRQTQIIMNKAIQYCWEYQGFSSDYKVVNGQYPKDKDILGLTLAGYIYDKLKDNTILYSANNSQSQQRAIKKWKTDIKDVYTGKKSIASYKQNNPIDLHNKSLIISKVNNGYCIGLKLLNRDGVREYGLESSSVDVAISVKDNSSKQIINRLISGEYKIGGSQIVKDKSKWFINLTYQFESVKNEIIKMDNTLGIDMGIAYPIYMAVNNSFHRDKIEGGEIEQFRKQVETRRNSMLRQGKHCGTGRIGHGVKTRVKPVEVLGDKISNFRSTCNHKYSRRVIDFALKHNCGVIQMEDLSGIAADEKKSTFLGRWSYFDLQQKIRYKAAEHGIEVKLVNPSYTSQRCSQCGYIHRGNRPKEDKGQSYFKCLYCEFETNADYNAAKNIATPDIERIIKEQL